MEHKISDQNTNGTLMHAFSFTLMFLERERGFLEREGAYKREREIILYFLKISSKSHKIERAFWGSYKFH